MAPASERPILCLTFPGDMLASAGDDGNVLLWVPSEQPMTALGEDHADLFGAKQAEPDNDRQHQPRNANLSRFECNGQQIIENCFEHVLLLDPEVKRDPVRRFGVVNRQELFGVDARNDLVMHRVCDSDKRISRVGIVIDNIDDRSGFDQIHLLADPIYISGYEHDSNKN